MLGEKVPVRKMVEYYTGAAKAVAVAAVVVPCALVLELVARLRAKKQD